MKFTVGPEVRPTIHVETEDGNEPEIGSRMRLRTGGPERTVVRIDSAERTIRFEDDEASYPWTHVEYAPREAV